MGQRGGCPFADFRPHEWRHPRKRAVLRQRGRNDGKGHGGLGLERCGSAAVQGGWKI